MHSAIKIRLEKATVVFLIILAKKRLQFRRYTIPDKRSQKSIVIMYSRTTNNVLPKFELFFELIFYKITKWFDLLYGFLGH